MSNNNWGDSRSNSGRPNSSQTRHTQMRDQVAKDHPNFNPISWFGRLWFVGAAGCGAGVA